MACPRKKFWLNKYHWAFFLVVLVPWAIIAHIVFTPAKPKPMVCAKYELLESRIVVDSGVQTEYVKVCIEFKEK